MHIGRKLDGEEQKSQLVDFSILIVLVVLSASCRGGYGQMSDDWYRSVEGRQIADNILSWQSTQGSWPKNVNTRTKPFSGDPNKISGTFDNGATTRELEFLTRAFHATKDNRYQQAIIRCLDHILKVQYPTGGWPQSYPPGDDYPRRITFNDGVMARLMTWLREVATSTDFQFVDADRRKAAKAAFDRGIECILKCQIYVNGKLTVWCAQHDEVDYSPRPARPYELVSLSGRESVDILLLLMNLDDPSPEVVRAVRAGVEWFDTAKLLGIRQEWIDGDKVIVKDPNAPPLWARFYEIETNRPFFCGRDGVRKYDIAEIEPERRMNYAWYGDWGRPVADRYTQWKENWLKEAGSAVELSSVGNAGNTGAGADSVVAADGSGQFKTVQEAVNAAPLSSSAKPWIIYIKAGTYKELIYVQREKRFVCLVGEDVEKTVLTYDLYAGIIGNDGKPIGTFRTPSTFIDADDFTVENITFENSAGPKGQALAIRIDGDRVVFRNCRFLGWQDTILANRGRHYFEGCYIAGHTDFIFGGATAFFEGCRIHCRRNGYITAASTPDNQPFGFVFSNCKITGESPDVKTYLGRPWRGFAGVIFLNTEMSEVIRPVGWHNWGQPDREKTSRYAEFGSTGPGANPQARVPWARLLTEAEAKAITVDKVLGGADGWNPKRAK